METYNQEVGKRLKQVRMLFNEGSKLTANQLAYLLNETGDKIRNYELGRASVPIQLLKKLQDRGINSAYLINGEGCIFNENDEVRRLKESILQKIKSSNNLDLLHLKKESELLKKIGI